MFIAYKYGLRTYNQNSDSKGKPKIGNEELGETRVCKEP